MLFLLWHAAEGSALGADDIAAIDALVAPWRRDVVIPLRDIRRALKPLEADAATAALRRQVQQIELEAERLQQETLFGTAAALGHPTTDRTAAAHTALQLYQTHLGTQFPPLAITTLITAALPPLL